MHESCSFKSLALISPIRSQTLKTSAVSHRFKGTDGAFCRSSPPCRFVFVSTTSTDSINRRHLLLVASSLDFCSLADLIGSGGCQRQICVDLNSKTVTFEASLPSCHLRSCLLTSQEGDDSRLVEPLLRDSVSFEKGGAVVLRREPLTFTSSICNHEHKRVKKHMVKRRSDYNKDKNHWLILEDVNNLSIDGSSAGIIDHNGKIWWQNSCKIDRSKALTLYNLKNLNVKNLRVRNALQIQISIEKCNNVYVKNVEITAPDYSPNTDGIHITNTQNIRISNSDIGPASFAPVTSDDARGLRRLPLLLSLFLFFSVSSFFVCAIDMLGLLGVVDPGAVADPRLVASVLEIRSGGVFVRWSLGDDNSKAYVSGINVDGAKLSETDNGVRIKTYQESAVQVNNVVYRNISGTSATDVAIMFNCSEKHPCQCIVLENVNIKGGTASCKNVVNVKDQGTVSPQCP
uniref:Uncharacterized protein n=1 Tax=Brassica campestris TaxID=3711 RepID=M4DDQ2_BRACM